MKLGEQPAFPLPRENRLNKDHYQLGMTLRQYYAGLAMQGLLASPVECQKPIAQFAVEFADALLAELVAKQGGGK